MPEYVIKNKESETKGSYFIEMNGEIAAEMTYSRAGTDRIIIDHTDVKDAYRGLKLGELLVRRAVQDAREKKLSIIPLCRFAKSVFDRHEDLRDVL